ncbi:MAG: flagellar biosynthesis anti-sigma factor FlgM [Deltaproteobacteria bacterium]|nr:MAG: flagellar biosynthesis anti-sigma factor FlgM [Deltaproteobacteria bacterium]
MVSAIKDTTAQGIQQYQKSDPVINEGAKPVGGVATVATERVDLSAKAKEFQQIKQIVDQTPDVRLDKVNELKDLVQSGNYTVDSGKVAAKIMGQSLIDTLA